MKCWVQGWSRMQMEAEAPEVVMVRAAPMRVERRGPEDEEREEAREELRQGRSKVGGVGMRWALWVDEALEEQDEREEEREWETMGTAATASWGARFVGSHVVGVVVVVILSVCSVFVFSGFSFLGSFHVAGRLMENGAGVWSYVDHGLGVSFGLANLRQRK